MFSKEKGNFCKVCFIEIYETDMHGCIRGDKSNQKAISIQGQLHKERRSGGFSWKHKGRNRNVIPRVWSPNHCAAGWRSVLHASLEEICPYFNFAGQMLHVTAEI